MATRPPNPFLRTRPLERPHSTLPDLFQPDPGQITIATTNDLKFIDHLQHKFADCVGFLPLMALEKTAEAGYIKLCMENGDGAGYILSRPHLAWQPKMRSITQACVAMDAQRRHHGLALLKTIEAEAIADGLEAIQACCAVGLDSNSFWEAAGFQPICHMTPDTKSQREVICWRKPLVSTLPPWFAFPPLKSGHRARPTVCARDPNRIKIYGDINGRFLTGRT